jgi:glycosyltransferase involved in cell wall biosynthesis
MPAPGPTDISIVVPTWNSAQYIIRTLESVVAQTIRGFETIVSDDGSRDGTSAVVEEFFSRHPDLNGRVVRNPHIGPGAARNAGLRAATRPWVAFLDSDDLWLPGKLARMADALRLEPGANIACHAEYHVLVDGRRMLLDYGAQFTPTVPLAHQLFAHNLFSTSATMIQRDFALSSGGFDTTLQSSQDYELWIRLSPSMRPVFVREPLGMYVDRPGNISSRKLLRRIRNQLLILYRHRRLVGSARAAGLLVRKATRKLRGGMDVTKGAEMPSAPG